MGESDGERSDGAGPTEAIASAAQAPRSALGPPRSEVSAAVTQRIRSAASSEPWMRTGGAPWSSSGRRSELAASWTTTEPRKARARIGRSTASSSRRPERHSRPPATRIVCLSAGIPRRSSSSMTAPTASWRGSVGAPGRGRERGSTTIATRPPRVTRSASLGPDSGYRSASPTAAVTSRSGSSVGGGARRTASSSTPTRGTREPESRGRRATPPSNHHGAMSRGPLRRLRGTSGGRWAASRAAATCATRADSSRASR